MAIPLILPALSVLFLLLLLVAVLFHHRHSRLQARKAAEPAMEEEEDRRAAREMAQKIIEPESGDREMPLEKKRKPKGEQLEEELSWVHRQLTGLPEQEFLPYAKMPEGAKRKIPQKELPAFEKRTLPEHSLAMGEAEVSPNLRKLYQRKRLSREEKNALREVQHIAAKLRKHHGQRTPPSPSNELVEIEKKLKSIGRESLRRYDVPEEPVRVKAQKKVKIKAGLPKEKAEGKETKEVKEARADKEGKNVQERPFAAKKMPLPKPPLPPGKLPKAKRSPAPGGSRLDSQIARLEKELGKI